MELISTLQNQPKKRVNRDNAKTPLWLLNYLYENFNISNDPCPLEEERDLDFDGLKEDWTGLSYVHPPHSETEAWVKKAAEQVKKGHFSVLFVPFIANSLYWREFVYPNVSEIRVLKCPVKLEGDNKQLTNQMCLLIFAAEFVGADPVVHFIEPEGWKNTFYKRQRNADRFAQK